MDFGIPTVTHLAHDLSKKERTEDVKLSGDQAEITFRDLGISPYVTEGLLACGFKKPSPVQVEAIPIGKCGYDILIQSKSGTGKTCVFTVLALEEVDISKRYIQVVILNPVRELAIQNADVADEIGCCMPGLKVQVFIGGTSVSANAASASDCHIAVGTPGRMAQLVREELMDVSKAVLLILDEADQLTNATFFPDVQYLMEEMTSRKRMIAASATYPAHLDLFIGTLMDKPKEVKIDSDTPVLIGVNQVVFDVLKVMEVKKHWEIRDEEVQARIQCLVMLIKHVRFSQAMIFCNYQLRASDVYKHLQENERFDVKLLSARLAQKDRTESFQSFRWGTKKLIVCTDLCARGLDSETLDLVINLELPHDLDTYQHRVGRAGRFGSTGTAINIIANSGDRNRILAFQKELRMELFVIENTDNLIQFGQHVGNVKALPKVSPPAQSLVPSTGIPPEYLEFCLFGPEDEKRATEIARLTQITPLPYSHQQVEDMISRQLAETDDIIRELLAKRRKNKMKRKAREAGEEFSSSSEDDDDDKDSDLSSLGDLDF